MLPSFFFSNQLVLIAQLCHRQRCTVPVNCKMLQLHTTAADGLPYTAAKCNRNAHAAQQSICMLHLPSLCMNQQPTVCDLKDHGVQHVVNTAVGAAASITVVAEVLPLGSAACPVMLLLLSGIRS